MFEDVGFGEYLDDENNYMPHMGAQAPTQTQQSGPLQKFGEGLLTQGLQIGTEAAKKELKIGDYKKQPAIKNSAINVNVPPLLSKKTLGIIGGVAVIGLIAFFMLRRRQE